MKKFVLLFVIFAVCAGLCVLPYVLFKPAKINANVVEERVFTSYIDGTGIAKCETRVLYAPINGVVKSIGYKKYDSVRKGTILLCFDDSEAKLALENSQVQLDILQGQAETARSEAINENIPSMSSREKAIMAAQDTGTDASAFSEYGELNEAKQVMASSYLAEPNRNQELSLQIEAAANKVKAAALALSFCTVTASENCEVLDIYVSQGQCITAGMPLMLVRTGELYIEGYFAEKYAADIEIGDTVLVYRKNQNASAPYEYSILRALHTVDDTTLGYAAGFLLAAKERHPLDRIGENFQIRKQIIKRSSPSVKISQVFYQDKALCVYKIVENRLVRCPIEIGLVNGDTMEVLEGIDTEDLIAENPKGLKEGQLVEIGLP